MDAALDFILDDVMGTEFLTPAARRGRGHQAPLNAEYIRDLREEDLLIHSSTNLASKAPTLERMRDTHHMLARLLASGKKAVEVSAITGFSQSRISILLGSPAFSELVEFYRGRIQDEFVDVTARIGAVALEATAELHTRLVDEPESLTTKELLAIAAMAHDRSGHGPTSTTRSVSMSLTGAELAAMKEEVKGALTGNVKTIEVVPEGLRLVGSGAGERVTTSPVLGEDSGAEAGPGVREEGAEGTPAVE